MIGWMFGESANAVGGSFKFQLEYSPKVAETSSNLTIVCYPNKSKKSVLPIRVRWFRLKNSQLNEIIGMRGCTYPCEPSDLGCKIKAEVMSLEDETAGTAEVWFGPIRIDISVKQLLAGVLTTGKTSFPVFVVRDKEKEARLEITEDEISLTDAKTEKKLMFEYSLAEPRVELNPKDITKLYFRFREDSTQEELKSFMSCLFEGDLEKSTRSQSRLFKNQNKLEVRFLSRPSRDLLVFCIKAFSAKKDMKSAAIIEKIERIDFTKEDLFQTFFQFQSLKSDILRLDALNRELMIDRDRKTKDLRDLEQEIASVTATYLKIIDQKCKENRLDVHLLNESYSQLSLKKDQATARNRIRNLQKQNSQLKIKIRDLAQQVELLQYFRKGADKDTSKLEVSIVQKQRTQGLLELSKINAKLLEENIKLKEFSRLERDKSRIEVANLLDSLNEVDESGIKEKYRLLQQQYNEIQTKFDGLTKQLEQKNKQQIHLQNVITELQARPEQSALITQSMINASMTSEAELNLLMDKFNDLKQINQKLLLQNQRHMKERQVQRKSALSQITELTQKLKKQKQQMSNIQRPNESGFETEMEELRSERRLLLKKIELLGESSKRLKDQLELEGRIQRLELELITCRKKLQLAQEQLINNMTESRTVFDQSGKLKEINEGLMIQITSLRKENECLKAMLLETEGLRRQVFNLRQQANGPVTDINPQLYEALKELEQAKNDRNLLEIKVKTQTQNIQKLIHQLHEKSHSHKTSFISDRSGKSTDKYKRRIKELEAQLELVRRSTDALNRSRDLSADMDQYNTETIQRLTAELDSILKENQRISEMCEKYARQAKQAQKIRNQNLQLRKQMELLQNRIAELEAKAT